MAHRDDLDAAMARADALERTVRELEQRMQDDQGDSPTLRNELKRTRNDREALAEQIRTLEDQLRAADSKREAVAQQLQKTEARLQAELAPRGQAKLPSLWDHNVAAAATAKPSELAPAGVACPRCRAEGHEVQLIKSGGGQGFRDLWLDEVVCPRCLLIAHKAGAVPEDLQRKLQDR